MRRIEINFYGSKPGHWRQPKGAKHIVIYTIMFLGICSIIWLCMLLHETWNEYDTRQKYLRHLTEQYADTVRQAPSQHSRNENPTSSEQAAALNEAIAQLNIPWQALFNALETANSPDIALISVHPNGATKNISIIAESANLETMLVYLRQLKKEAIFSELALRRHEQNEQIAQKPIRFEIEAKWEK